MIEPYIIDTTLRDGEQAPGVVFSKKEKMKIAYMLEEMGVDEVEIGTPAISNEEKKIIKAIASEGFSYKTSSWCRANMNDIKEASTLKTTSINISLPVSDIQINTLGRSRDWVLSELKKTTMYACSYFNHVTVGAQDATRANIQFLHEYISLAKEFGANRIRIADTVGISSPLEIQELFLNLSSHFPNMEFEFHGHNDLGMATANAITAYKSGAKCLSATVNGLGERAGNSVLEELIAYFIYKENSVAYNGEIVSTLCNFVADIAKVKLALNKPLIGEKVHTHESGIHTSAILKNKKSYQFINPSDFGVDTEKTAFCFGKHSGKASIHHFFKEKNLLLDDQRIQQILNLVKESASSWKRPLTEIDLMQIYLANS
ncbi:hypothetical protein ACFQ5N_13265 [Lutibacter holmesii]|uniref:Pyruvate carboxyltransferase domain-containing protein n=1 Tax=Lutibacter holmesii TaxID=1137985 RepID=A0ABW3WSA8_9FLAO